MLKETVADETERRLLYEHVAFDTGSMKCQRIILFFLLTIRTNTFYGLI
jgi:hypothetical protein